MKFKWIWSILVLCTFNVTAQVCPINDFPLYKFGYNQEGLIHFAEKSISDTIKVWVTLNVEFSAPFVNKEKNLVKKTEILEAFYANRDMTDKSPTKLRKKNLSKEYKILWDVYEEYIQYWFE